MSTETDEEKKGLREIRNTAALLGYDISEYTDKEVKKAVIEMSVAIASCGFTTEQALDGLNSMKYLY